MRGKRRPGTRAARGATAEGDMDMILSGVSELGSEGREREGGVRGGEEGLAPSLD